MKKLYIILLLALSIPAFSQTQEDKYESQVYFGIGGNLNSVWIMNQNTYGEPELKYAVKLGYAFNLNLGYDFSKNWGIKTEVGYGIMGQKYDDTQYGIATTRNITLGFVQIPLLLKWRSGGEKVKFYIAAGPQLNILLSGKQDYLRGGVSAPEYNGIDVSKSDIKDRYQSLNGVVRADLGVDLKVGAKWFMNIGLSGGFAVTDANKPEWRYYNVNDDYYISHNIFGGLNVGINHVF